jgi:putative transposase
MVVRRTSHSVYETGYHLVWCPKYRKKLFDREEMRKRAEQLIREISSAYDFEIIELEVSLDHVHIFAASNNVCHPFDRLIG